MDEFAEVKKLIQAMNECTKEITDARIKESPLLANLLAGVAEINKRHQAYVRKVDGLCDKVEQILIALRKMKEAFSYDEEHHDAAGPQGDAVDGKNKEQ